MVEARTLSPELENEVDGYLWAKTEVLDLCGDLSQEQFNWRPEEGAWSVGECLDHLNKVGSEMIAPMHEAMEKGKAAGRLSEGPFRYSWLGNYFARAAGVLNEDNTFKGKSPKLYVPGSDMDKDKTIERFLKVQDELITTTRMAHGLDLKRIKVASPALKFMRFSLGVWLRMLPNHQRRHFQQARNVVDRMAS